MTGERVETAGGYVPTTRDVRAAYAMADEAWGGCLGRSPETLRAEFDRWLAQVRADAYAQGGRDALTAAADEAESPADTVTAPHIKRHVADWLRARAAQIGADQ